MRSRSIPGTLGTLTLEVDYQLEEGFEDVEALPYVLDSIGDMSLMIILPGFNPHLMMWRRNFPVAANRVYAGNGSLPYEDVTFTFTFKLEIGLDVSMEMLEELAELIQAAITQAIVTVVSSDGDLVRARQEQADLDYAVSLLFPPN